MKQAQIGLGIAFSAFGVWLVAGPAAAQSYSPDYRPGAYPSPVRNMSGLVSGYEAWRLHDIRRQAEIGRQVDLNADMYWRWSGVSSYYPGAFEAWPMVPGNIWGWPAAISPPVVSSTRVPPQFDPEFAQPPTASSPAATRTEGLPTPPPNFRPAPETSQPARPSRAVQGELPSTRRQIVGPRQF